MPAGSARGRNDSLSDQLSQIMDRDQDPDQRGNLAIAAQYREPDIVTDMKERFALVAKERAALPVPVESSEWPLPRAGLTCKFCRREFRSTPNPMRDRACPYPGRVNAGGG